MFKSLPTILQIYMITVEVVSGSVKLHSFKWCHRYRLITSYNRLIVSLIRLN